MGVVLGQIENEHDRPHLTFVCTCWIASGCVRVINLRGGAIAGGRSSGGVMSLAGHEGLAGEGAP